jgi:hypothetical protein
MYTMLSVETVMYTILSVETVMYTILSVETVRSFAARALCTPDLECEWWVRAKLQTANRPTLPQGLV